MRLSRRHVPYMIFFVLAIFILRGPLSSGSSLLTFLDGPPPPSRNQIINDGLSALSPWNPNDIGHPRLYDFGWVLRVVFLMLAYVVPSLTATSTILYTILLGSAGTTAYVFLRSLKMSLSASTIAAIFYMLSPVTFNETAAGHTNFIFSLALSPLVLLTFYKSISGKTIRNSGIILCGFILGIASAQGQFLLMLALVLLIIASATSLTNRNLTGLKILPAIVAIALLVQLPVIYQILANQGSVNTIAVSSHTTDVATRLSPGLINAIYLTGFAYPAYQSATEGIVSLAWYCCLTILLVVSAWVLMHRNARSKHLNSVVSFFVIAIIGLFLMKGISQPLGFVNEWIYLYVPLIGALFRDSYQFSFLVLISYTGLFAVTFDSRIAQPKGLPQSICTRLPIVSWKSIQSKRILLGGILCLVALMPYMSGTFGGFVTSYDFGKQYQVYESLSSPGSDYNMIWIPSSSVVKYPGWNHEGRDPFQIYPPVPSTDVFDWPGTPSQIFSVFSDTALRQNRTNDMSYLWALEGARFMVYRSGISSDITYPSLASWIPSQKGLNQVGANPYPVFENARFDGTIYTPSMSYLVFGDLSSIISYDYLSELWNGSDYPSLPAFFFASQLSPLQLREMANRVNAIIVDSSSIQSLPFFFLSSMSPGSFAKQHSDPNLGWTNFHYWNWGTGNWPLVSNPDDMAVTNVRDQLQLNANFPGNSQIWAEVAFGSGSSGLNFSFGGTLLGTISPSRDLSSPEWIMVGTTPASGGQTLSIRSERGPVAVLKVAMATPEELNLAREDATNIIVSKPVINIVDLSRSIGGIATSAVGAIAANGNVSSSTKYTSVDLTIPTTPSNESEVFLRASGMLPLLASNATMLADGQSQPLEISATDPSYNSTQVLLDPANSNTVRNWSVNPPSITQLTANSSALAWTYSNNKTRNNNDTTLERLIEASDWTPYNSLSFWIDPETTRQFQLYLIVADRQADGSYASIRQDVSALATPNQWNQVVIDLSNFQRSNIHSLYFQVQDAHPAWQNGQNTTFLLRDFELLSAPKQLQWFKVTQVSHPRDTLTLRLNVANGLMFDLAAILPRSWSPDKPQVSTTSIHQLSPTEYSVSVSSGGPSFVVLTNTFDDKWSINGPNAQPIIVNGFANAFYLPSGNGGQMTITYEGAQAYSWALVISASVPIAAMALGVWKLAPRSGFLRKRHQRCC